MSISLVDTRLVSCFIKSIFILSFIFPTKYCLEALGLPIDSYIYGLLTVFLLFNIFGRQKQSIVNIFYIIVIFILVIIHKQVTPLHLLSLIVLDYICSNKEYYINQFFQFSYVKKIGLLGIIIYSLLYYGYLDRFAYLGVGEVNISGLGIFLLGVILLKVKENLGKLVLIFGMLTFSRNYFLALLSFIAINKFIENKSDSFCYRLVNLFTFFKIGVVSCVILYFVSFLFQKMYNNGLILDYVSGVNRLTSFFEISNYHRFIINTNVLEIYIEHPDLIFTGIPIPNFAEYNLEICKLNGHDFANDRPHNFFYSYLQIYGCYCVLIFLYMIKIFKNIVNRYNLGLFISIMIYGIFLGMGLSGYWLGLSVIALIITGYRNE